MDWFKAYIKPFQRALIIAFSDAQAKKQSSLRFRVSLAKLRLDAG